MTTTLRPTEPLHRSPDGTRRRHYQVCDNSRPIGEITLSTDPRHGPSAALVDGLRIEEPDRRRGRATVAVLAAEEVARGWGCERIEADVPGDAEAALRLATALGYEPRSRIMSKRLGDTPPELPPGSRVRTMTTPEFEVWRGQAVQRYVEAGAARGLPATRSRELAERDQAQMFPQGPATPGVRLSVLEHEGTVVGYLWLSPRDGTAYVWDVGVDAAHRGRGHGRSLMLAAEAYAVDSGSPEIGLNVFAGNTPAERLYESLGYRTVTYRVHKSLR
ncbi:GNAT superfamily N-acetyltransferase [Streptomyces sp. B3I7]|uniref:GNAT family N-acetyltransferase n=1 Tax=unclassified Streptomyces TaxID=2593676 RepID=UPI00277D8325|nr:MULTISPECIES: GNAT family N-acetyltransferase [unclassified Streptomyces]MDQ0785956.1 GNAT superfamily N-acetyltransferase [Streptomyces sp. B3I8]MDQ0814445.1 GNAT superfamily N-acetyltransferase [Streptomyces sp. B3I7]